MERSHWLRRKRASIAMAENAESGEAKLIHYDLAGRYSVKAADATPQLHVEDEPPFEASHDGKPVPPSSLDRS